MNRHFKNLYGTTVTVERVERRRGGDYVIGHTQTGAKVHISKKEFDKMFIHNDSKFTQGANLESV